MNHAVSQSLWALSERFVQAWQQSHAGLPQTEAYFKLSSPCEHQVLGETTIWQPVKREQIIDFINVEQGIELDLHPDIKAFYGSQFCADLTVNFQGESIELVQVWSEEDLIRLQENMLGHFVMQRRLKKLPSMFIASTQDDSWIISICNLSGEIFREHLGKHERQKIADNTVDFLNQLTPEIVK